MFSVLRIGVVVTAMVALLASAGGPKRHTVQSSMTITEPYATTWAALLELFAEKKWAIRNMNEKAGLLTTDWLDLGEEAERYADCGKATLIQRSRTQVEFEIRVRATATGTDVNVGAAFRREASAGGFTNCTSRGSVETAIQNDVAVRANKRVGSTEPEPAPPVAAAGFYCASSVATPSVSICARQQQDCENARAAIAPATADIAVCARAASAWCYDVHCSATRDACAAQREAAGSAASECVENR
jgi:hypothetical protein